VVVDCEEFAECSKILFLRFPRFFRRQGSPPLYVAVRLLVTAALPYCQRSVSTSGHLVEYVPNRHLRSVFKNSVQPMSLHLATTRTHGRSYRARKEGRSELELIAEMSESHHVDFASFGVESNYGQHTQATKNRKNLWPSFWQFHSAPLRLRYLLKDAANSSIPKHKRSSPIVASVAPYVPNVGCRASGATNCTCGRYLQPDRFDQPGSYASGPRPGLKEATHLFAIWKKMHGILSKGSRRRGARLAERTATISKGTLFSRRSYALGRHAARHRLLVCFEIPTRPGNYWYVWFGRTDRVHRQHPAMDANGTAKKLRPIGSGPTSDACERVHHFQSGKDDHGSSNRRQRIILGAFCQFEEMSLQRERKPNRLTRPH